MKAVIAIILGVAMISFISVVAEAQQLPAPADITVKLTPSEWTILINSAQASINAIVAKIQTQYREQAAAKIKAQHPSMMLVPPKPPSQPVH